MRSDSGSTQPETVKTHLSRVLAKLGAATGLRP